MGEGVDNNPVVWDFFADLAWTDAEHIDIDGWFIEWVHARYGVADPDAFAAWQGLLRTAYSSWLPIDGVRNIPPKYEVLAGADSVFAAKPSLHATGASPLARPELVYGPEQLEHAWHLLLAAGDR